MSAQADRDVYLVLDQAEEYFLYHADDGGPGSFAEALPGRLGCAAASATSSSPCAKTRSPSSTASRVGFQASSRTRSGSIGSTGKPAARRSSGRSSASPSSPARSSTVEPELVERVLDEVGAGRIEPALGGRRRDRTLSRTAALASRRPISSS